MTLFHYFLIYCGACYTVSVVWFMILNRHDGFFKWRLLSTLVAPLAVPVMMLVVCTINSLESFFKWRKNRKDK